MRPVDKSNKISKFIMFSILAVLLTGLLTTIFFSKDVNEYENRYADKIKKLAFSSFLDKSFQDSFELALSDQIQLSTSAKKVYNIFDTSLARIALNPLRKSYDGYIYNKGNIIYRDMLLFAPYPYQQTVYWLDFKIENYNKLFVNYPDLDFYVYYIEKDTDIDFAKNEESGFYEYIKEKLELDKNRISGFEVNDFNTFNECFYTTDHHWNYLGSYKGYTDVVKLLDKDMKPLEPLETVTSLIPFQGSKAIGFENVLSDTMSIYRFDFPEMDIYINGEKAQDYGSQQDFLLNSLETIGYGSVYGDDAGEVIFNTGSVNSNILVIGESYDNAIIKL
ncbi:MAG: hypothetical protein GXY21_10395, partial [Clostridiaceae bacterium]|nr:hypothetical protein [Clostridiaceae bacterium]